jgi:signal transduction histidine kinase
MEALGNLAGGIAHDFNNMLLPILNLTEMTKEDLPADHPVQENLSLVIEAAQRASQLVKQILAFGRRGDRQVEILDMSECAAEALRLLRNVLPATITIVDRIESNIGAVQADASELQSIILNLGSNSAHAMTGKAGRLTVALTHLAPDPALAVRHAALSPDRAYARLEVADTGHGMDAATMAKIFNPFFTTKPVGEGTGLGLAMVHGIVENLGGAIEVSSEVGVGTTFVIYVPLVERKAA